VPVSTETKFRGSLVQPKDLKEVLRKGSGRQRTKVRIAIGENRPLVRSNGRV